MVRELGNSAREQQVIGKREKEKKEVRGTGIATGLWVAIP